FDSDGLPLYPREEIHKLFSVDARKKSLTEENDQVEEDSIIGGGAVCDVVEESKRHIAQNAVKAKTHIGKDRRRAHLKVVPDADIHGDMHDEEDSLYKEKASYQDRNQISHLKNTINLLENIVALKDDEIKSLKAQNEWLQTRIERMEERANREQVLLLAESETVRKLIWEKKRSPLRAALEWMGLVPQTPNRNNNR
ncbi:MAG: hypothetical protein D6808_00440, partial [Candidatus Dadabacteria bacterium]